MTEHSSFWRCVATPPPDSSAPTTVQSLASESPIAPSTPDRRLPRYVAQHHRWSEVIRQQTFLPSQPPHGDAILDRFAAARGRRPQPRARPGLLTRPCAAGRGAAARVLGSPALVL
jgi:hypothetical protein